MVGPGHPHEVGECSAEVDPAVRAEAERRPGRHRFTRVRVAAVTHRAGAAADLERHDHPVADRMIGDGVPERHDLAGHLVSQREGERHGIQTGGDRRIEVTTGDGERPYHGVAVVLDPGVGNLSPVQFSRSFEHQGAHGRMLRAGSQGGPRAVVSPRPARDGGPRRPGGPASRGPRALARSLPRLPHLRTAPGRVPHGGARRACRSRRR